MSAARGQLHAAIRLWFGGGDPVAIHTLASAAHEIVHSLFRKKGLKGLAFDNPKVRPDRQQKWASDLKLAANFFKHGRNETADAQFELNPAVTEMMMMACCKGLKDIGEPIGMEELALTYWKFCTSPEDFPGRESLLNTPKIKMLQEFTTKGREVYFREFAAAWDSRAVVFTDGRTGLPTN